MALDTISGLPLALEQVLLEAAHDKAFRHALLTTDRLAAVEQRGHQLGQSERAMLEAVPQQQLGAVLDRLAGTVLPEAPLIHVPPRLPCEGIRPGSGRLILGAAITTAALGGAATCAYMTLATGSRPDTPPVVQPTTTTNTDAGVDVDRIRSKQE